MIKTETRGAPAEDSRFRAPSRLRFAIFLCVLCGAVVAVLAHYGALMLGGGAAKQTGALAASAERGQILDRNHVILALEARFGNVTAWRPDVADLDALSRTLSVELGMTAAEIADRIRLSSSDFVYVKKQVTGQVAERIESLKAAGQIPGIGVEPVFGRVYPQHNLASQLIGFVGNENTGLAGVEYAFNDELAAKPAAKPASKPAAGTGAKAGAGAEGGSVAGDSVILTIDTNVQYLLEEIAGKTLKSHGAEAVMLFAMDPRSGEILGAASLPDFDPNDFRSSTEAARMNRSAVWAYEPGSVFKLFSMAALLDSGAISDGSVFVCNGAYEHITNRGERVTINCLGAHGRVRPRDIIIQSCNAGAAYASDNLGGSAFYERIRALGFGERTASGNPGETAGYLLNVERWSDRSKPTIAMGQEIAVSALQMLQAATAIANDGVLVTPHIVLSTVSPDGQTTLFQTPPPKQVLSVEAARLIRSYMEDVTSVGTGTRANVADISLAVKTGTAQIIDPKTGAYSSTDFIASCMALLPADKPVLAIYLVIIKPQGEYLGGRIAAPVVREAAEAVVDYLGIPRGRNEVISHTGEVRLGLEGTPEVRDTIPDFTGLTKVQILPLVLRDDLTFEINGAGRVVRQSPPPGSPVRPDTRIVLEFE